LKKSLALAAAFLVFAFALSCGDDGNGNGPTPAPAWEKVNVRAVTPAVSTSLVMAGDGTAHMAFMDNSGQSLVVYATYKDNSLSVRAVGSSGYGLGRYASLALDGGDEPHIAFYGGPPVFALFYNNMRGSGFVTVDDDGHVGRWPSIQADAAKRPRISYYDSTQGDLRYARYDGSKWRVEVVDGTGDTGLNPSLALDGSGDPHVAYYDRTNGSLRYARRGKNKWTFETVDNAGDVGKQPALVLDNAGTAHVLYNDVGKGRLKYATRAGGSWQVTPLSFAVEGHTGAALALDSSGGLRRRLDHERRRELLRRRRPLRPGAGQGRQAPRHVLRQGRRQRHLRLREVSSRFRISLLTKPGRQARFC
jgi:hypothetical protein